MKWPVSVRLWSSAAVACPLQGSTRAFRDALLHSAVVTGDYLSYRQLEPVLLFSDLSH